MISKLNKNWIVMTFLVIISYRYVGSLRKKCQIDFFLFFGGAFKIIFDQKLGRDLYVEKHWFAMYLSRLQLQHFKI
jgi:hypothetical protein